MKTVVGLGIAVLLIASSGGSAEPTLKGTVYAFAATLAPQQTQFGLWSAGDLSKRDAALSTRVGDDHSARETLADYGHHRFRLLYRDADGAPEQHDAIVDVVVVKSGEGTLQLGGEMLGRRPGSGAGEFVGTRLEGGERHRLGAGDVVHIPAGIPHSFLVPKGGHITYLLVKFPAE
jgi:mannose-6-phosphate isomerase-like protein (cupin superfamily)